MGSAIELPDVKDIAFVLEDGCLVVVTVEVMWTREEGHNGWETCRPRLPIHPIAKITARINLRNVSVSITGVPSILSFVRSDDRQQLVPLQELCDCLITNRTISHSKEGDIGRSIREEVRTTPDVIV